MATFAPLDFDFSSFLNGGGISPGGMPAFGATNVGEQPMSEPGFAGGTPTNAENLLDQLFSNLMGGNAATNVNRRMLKGGGNPFIGHLAKGMVPAPLQAQLDQNLARSRAGITESFGSMGSRFGTDLASTLGSAEGQMINDFLSGIVQRSLQAEALRQQASLGAMGNMTNMAQILGSLGLQREEGGMNRSLQDLLSLRSTDPNNIMLLLSMLGGGL